MHNSLKILIEITRKSTRFLGRDFYELEDIQSSANSTENFVKKSYGRVAENLQDELGRHYKAICFNLDDVNNLVNKTHGSFDKAAFVDVADGSSNFRKAHPYFATVVSVVEDIDGELKPKKTVVNFPALGELYYAERGKGAWFERYNNNYTGSSRLRVSGVFRPEDYIIGTDVDNIERSKKISHDIRIFGSPAYSTMLVARGKLDCAILSHNDLTTHGLSLILKEAGGVICKHDDYLVASNREMKDIDPV